MLNVYIAVVRMATVFIILLLCYYTTAAPFEYYNSVVAASNVAEQLKLKKHLCYCSNEVTPKLFTFHSLKFQASHLDILCQQMCDQHERAQRVHIEHLWPPFAARHGEFPHMAAIGYGRDASTLKWLCGGTLISHYFVLTAAHCTHDLKFGPATFVRLGTILLEDVNKGFDPRNVAIVKLYIHPQYKYPFHYHDIALLKLEKRILFNTYAQPAFLHDKKNVPNSFTDYLEAAGWGELGWSGSRPNNLMKVHLRVVDFKSCFKYYENSSRKLKDGILDDYQICAGGRDYMSGGDTCLGDSGGPLHYISWPQGVHYVAGITSFGKPCAVTNNSIGVYTRVSAYVNWIRDIVCSNESDPMCSIASKPSLNTTTSHPLLDTNSNKTNLHSTVNVSKYVSPINLTLQVDKPFEKHLLNINVYNVTFINKGF